MSEPLFTLFGKKAENVLSQYQVGDPLYWVADNVEGRIRLRCYSNPPKP